MAEINALRTFLKDVIGLGNNTNGTARANAIIEEGLGSITELVDLSHENGVKTLCYNVRKPAGMMAQVGWTEPDPNPQNLTAPMVPKPGYAIPTMCEQRLKMAAYGAKLYASINRTITTGSLNRNRLRQLQKHFDTIDNQSDPDSLPDLSKSFTVQKFLEQFPTHLREILGTSKVALSYVIREGTVVPVTPPALAQDKPWSVENEDMMEELIAYTPHSGPSFQADNARVYSLLVKALAGSSALASTSRHQSKRDGRGAYLDLVMHHLSSAKWEKSVAAAERLLSERKWNGRNQRYPLKVHISRQREAFNDMSRASEQITYNPPNETSRVRYLLQSIETSDPTVCSAKTTIQADGTMKNDFEAAADFLIVTAPVTKHQNNQNHNVSAVNFQKKGGNKNSNKWNRKGGKRGKVDTGPKTGVELRYYQPGEWRRLTQDQRDECISIRKNEKRKRDDSADKSAPQTKIAALESQIKEMKEQIVSAMASRSVSLPPVPPTSTNPPSALRPPRFTQRE